MSEDDGGGARWGGDDDHDFLTPSSVLMELLADVADNDDTIGSKNGNAISSGNALSDENNNQQTMGMRVMMAKGDNNAK